MLKLTLLATVAIALCAVPAAQAQGMPDFTRMNLNGVNSNFNARLNGAMAQRQQQIVQDNLNNPQAMAAYRAGACGPGLTPQQFAYKYAATGGCTPQGYANYNNTTRQIAANDQAAYQRYQAAQAARAQAMAQQQQGFANNQYQTGMQLGGWRYSQTNPTIWYRP